MDRTQASGAWDRGSIPFGGTKRLYKKKSFCYYFFVPLKAVLSKFWTGSSVWLERCPVTAEVAGSSPVRSAQPKNRLVVIFL